MTARKIAGVIVWIALIAIATVSFLAALLLRTDTRASTATTIALVAAALLALTGAVRVYRRQALYRRQTRLYQPPGAIPTFGTELSAIVQEFLRLGKGLLWLTAIGMAIAVLWIGLSLASDWTSSLLPTDLSGLTKMTALGFALVLWMQYQSGRVVDKLSARIDDVADRLERRLVGDDQDD